MTPSQINVKKTAVKTSVHQSGKRAERVVEEETDEVEEDDELTNSQASDDLNVSKIIQNMVKSVSLSFFVCHRSFQDLLSSQLEAYGLFIIVDIASVLPQFLLYALGSVNLNCIKKKEETKHSRHSERLPNH